MLKIFIALSTYNRKKITSLCLDNLKNIIDNDGSASLSIYDDASTTYDEKFLKKYSDNVLRFRVNGGIERSRARAVREFAGSEVSAWADSIPTQGNQGLL